MNQMTAWLSALQDNAFVESMKALFGPAREFVFIRPWWLLGLLTLPLLMLWWRRKRGDRGVWREAIDPHLLRHLLQSEESASSGRTQRVLRSFGRVAAFAGCVLLFVALAGPSWRSQPQPLWQDKMPLVIALDLSERILATDLQPSRLQRARAEIAEVLRRRGGGQMALVVYAGDAFTVTPLTEDGANIALYLDSLHPNIMPERGSRTDRGIAESALLLKRAGFPRGDILVITDMLDGDERRAEKAASDAAGQGYRVSVLGLASERGAARLSGPGIIRLDGPALQALANEGGGRYAQIAGDDSDLRALGVLDAQPMDATAAGGKRGMMALDEGYWLLPLLMLAALFGFRRGALAVVALLCWLPLQSVQAAESGFWLRGDQRQHRELKTAEEAYRKRDYQSAERLWAKTSNADGAYNLGNALARQGRYQEAVDAYDQALRMQPGMEDAIENRRIVLEAMRKQKTPPQNRQDQKQDQKRNDQKQGDQKQGDQKQGDQKQGDQKQGDQKQGDRQQRQQQGQEQQNQQQQGRQQDPRQDGREQQARQQEDAREQASKNSAGKPKPEPRGNNPKDDDPKAQREAEAAQRANMDRALAKQGAREVPAGQDERGRERTPMTAEQRQQQILIEARLRRVPDDPGGLLRAKFNQESLRRMRRRDR
jgi:Ca-activated chloride channel homolog